MAAVGAVSANLLDRLHPNIAERDRVVVAGEAEVAGRAVLAGVRAVAHELGHLAQVGVEDAGAVQFDLDASSR